MNIRETVNCLDDEMMPRQVMTGIYGDNVETIRSRRKHWLSALQGFARRFGGDGDAQLARAPGRANLMGMHIEHQGGSENHVLLSREVLAVARQNLLGLIRICNASELHASYEINVGSPIRRQSALSKERGWWRYLDGVISALSGHCPREPLLGADVFVYSDLPEAATLGSSSALSVALGVAFRAINHLQIDDREMIDIIAQGEKMAGVDGGPGDPAAMLLGRFGHLVHIQYNPIQERLVAFPPNCAVVVCYSGKSAAKATNARDLFHQRIAAYTLARLLIKQFRPELAQRIKYLRDMNPEQLCIDVSEIYSLIKRLPTSISRAQALALLPNSRQELDDVFSTHAEPLGGYPVRGVCFYGVAEHARAERCVRLLRTGDMRTFGRLMLIGHDGDRVVQFEGIGGPQRYDYEVGDAHLSALANTKPVPELWSQPGSYRCSTEELDAIVDIARRVEGVYGARLTGSGLGGCAVVLCERSAGPDVETALYEQFYDPRGIEPIIWVDQPVAAASVVSGFDRE